MRRILIHAAVLSLLSTQAAGHLAADESTWRYDPDIGDVSGIAIAMATSETLPVDCASTVEFKSETPRFLQLRYGSQNSRRVLVAVDPISRSDVHFYVDQDRDRELIPEERIEGAGRSVRLELDAEIIEEDDPIQELRTIELRYSPFSRRIMVKTLGCVTGVATLAEAGASGEDKVVAIRRLDGNANGLLTDNRDQILLDLNDDGDWDPVTEHFPCLPILVLDGRRYSPVSDRFGTDGHFDAVTGTGRLNVEISSLPKNAKITAFEAMVFSADGAAYSLKSTAESQEVPVGKYTLGSITVTIAQGDNQPWHFVFSRSGAIRSSDWCKLEKGKTLVLQGIGNTRFLLQTSLNEYAADQNVTVNPRLYTEHGLLINLCSRGKQIGDFAYRPSHAMCQISLTSADKQILAATTSGFA